MTRVERHRRVVKATPHSNQSSQLGPCHQKRCSRNATGSIPRNAQSAGFCTEGTCRQKADGRSIWTSDTRLATKTCQLEECLRSYSRTIEESIQMKVRVETKGESLCTRDRSFARRAAAHSSSRGTLMVLTGATRIFAATRVTLAGSPSPLAELSSTRRPRTRAMTRRQIRSIHIMMTTVTRRTTAARKPGEAGADPLHKSITPALSPGEAVNPSRGPGSIGSEGEFWRK